jgi:fibronectin-binding autotransporter adhesin
VKTRSRILLAAALLASNSLAQAADVPKAGTGTDLASGASWTGGNPPTSADTAVWETGSLGSGLTLASPASWGGIRIHGALSDVGISGIGALTLGSGGINTTGSGRALTLGNPILASGAQTWATDATMSFTGAITGSDPLQIQGTSQTSQTYAVYQTPTATLAFPNTSLAAVTGAQGLMDGAFVQGVNVPALGYKFENNGTVATFQFRFFDGGFTKCVKVELTQVGADIHSRAVYAKYYNSNGTNNLAIDFDTVDPLILNGTIATSVGASGYGAASTSILFGQNSAVTLSGFSSHSGGMTFAGGNVSGGTGVAVNQSQGGSFGTGNVTIQPGTTLTTSGERVLGGGNITTRTVSINGATANINAAALGGEYFRTLNLSGGTLTATNATTYFRTPNGGCNINSLPAATPSTISTGIDMTFSSIVFDAGDGVAADDLVVSGIITQNTGAGSGAKSITKNGAGTLFLTRANTFSGNVSVNAGTLKIGNRNSLGAFLAGRPASQVTVASGAAIDFGGVVDATYGYTIAGNGVGGTGALTNSGGGIATGVAQCSNITLAAPASIGGSGNWALLTNGYGTTNLDLQGHTLTKTGGNAISLASTTVTAGDIQVSQGTLALGVTNGGTGVNAASTALTLLDSSGVNLLVNRNSSVGSLAGGVAAGGNITLTSSTLTVGTLGTDTTFAGNMSGNGSLTKTGSGSLTLTGALNQTGTTTVSGGTLTLTGPHVGPLVVQENGTLSPGGVTTATVLCNGDITLGGTLEVQLTKSGATLGQDTLDTLTAVNFGGSLVVTASGDALANGDTFQLFEAASYAGTFANLVLPVLPTGLSWNIDNLAVDGSLSVSTRVTSPSFSPGSGAYPGNPAITITSDPAATIRYTTDGSTPTASSTLYTGPVIVPSNVLNFQIRAIALIPGQTDSNIATATYNTTDIPSWNVDDVGEWSNPGNWLRGVIPNQVGVVADFTFPQSGDTPVTLDTNRTVGGLVFGNANEANWSLISTGGSVLNLQTNSGSPTILVTSNTATLAAPLAGTQGFTRTGAGNLVLSAASTLSGMVTLDGGRTTVSNNTALGTASLTLGTGADPVFLYLGNRADIANPITVSAAGSGAVVIGGDDTGGGTNAASYLGAVTLNRPTTFSGEVLTDRLTFEGRITGNVGTLTVTGGGRVTLISPTNDFVGDILVTGAGTILQSGANTTPESIPDTSSITVSAGAIFQITPSLAGTETINALHGSGTVRGFPTASIPATLALGGAGGSGNFGGIISNGLASLSVTKLGAGTQTLGGINTYTGATTVNGGTLAVTGSLASGSAVTVAAAGTLSGTGTVAGAVTAAGTLAPGNGSSAGTLTLGNTVLTGTYRCEIDGASSDRLATGTLNISGASLDVTELSPGTAFPYTIATYTAGGLTGTFASVTPGYSVDDSVDGVLTLIQTGAGFASWAAANAPGQTMDQDHDADGTPNGVEYFMGESGSGFTTPAVLGPNHTVSFTKGGSYTGVYGTDYVIQTSTNLGTWTDVLITDPNLNNGSPLQYTLAPGGGTSFVRLKVIGPL